MATFSVDVVVNSKSVNELEQDLQSLETQFKALKIGDPGFTELGNKIKGVRSQLKDVELQFEGLDKEQRATALVDTFNGLTGAVGAVSSAFIAFGASSEAIEDAEKKLLGVIGVVNGLRDVSNATIAANKLLGGSFKAAFTTATGAINVTRVALAGLGIGALIFAVTELADAFDIFGTKAAEANDKAARSISNAEQATKNAITTIKDKSDIAIANAKLEGKSEADLLAIKKQSIQDQLDAIDSLAGKQNADLKRKAELAKGDEKLLQEANDEFKKQAEANRTATASLNKELELLDIGFKQGKKDRNAKESEEAKAKRAKDKADAVQAEKDRIAAVEAARVAALDQIISAELSANDAARQLRAAQASSESAAIQIEYENKLAALKEAQIQEEIAVAGNAEALALIEKKYTDLAIVADTEVQAKFEDLDNKATDAQIANADKVAANNKENADKIIAAEQAKQNAQDNFINASRGAINALGGLFEEGSAAAKTAALTDIAIGTGVGFINALDIAQKSSKLAGPGAAFAFPIFYASQIAAVLGAASRAKAILNSGKGGGSSSAPNNPPAPSIPTSVGTFAPAATPTIPQITGGTLAGGESIATGTAGIRGPVKTYVLAGDVTSAQQAEALINQKRKF
jgi:hypothetical protein